MRKLIRVDLLILDDLCLTGLDGADTADVYELIVERHHQAATVVTSNRSRSSGSASWPTPFWPSRPSTGSSRRPMSSPSTETATGAGSDPRPGRLPKSRPASVAAGALDHRLGRRHHRLVDAGGGREWSHAVGGEVVPSRWRATGVDVPADCDLDGFTGGQPGFHIAGLNLFIGRARPVHTM